MTEAELDREDSFEAEAAAEETNEIHKENLQYSEQIAEILGNLSYARVLGILAGCVAGEIYLLSPGDVEVYEKNVEIFTQHVRERVTAIHNFNALQEGKQDGV